MTDSSCILLVEDNPDDEALTLRALQSHHLGNPVEVVRDGAEAIDYLFAQGNFAERDRSRPPRLILLDLGLPKIDGLQVLRRVRDDPRLRRTPVVVLTSSDEESDIVDSYDLGANGYVRKPVEFDEFVNSVQQLGLYWLLINKAPPVRS